MTTPQFHPLFRQFTRPLLIGHRGCSGLFPENTMLSFKKAVEFQADVLELDVHMTKDGHFVVSHDRSPLRTTNFVGGEDKIWADFTLEEIQSFDAGYHFQSTNYDKPFPFRGEGIQIPTLREILREFPDVVINIDMKHHVPEVPPALSSLLRSEGATNRVIVCSMKDKILDLFRQIEPEIPTGAGPGEVIKFYGWHKIGLAHCHSPRASVFEVPSSTLLKKFTGWGLGSDFNTRSIVDAAHRNGQKIFHWWANEPEEINALLDLGTDGVMTDRVDIGLSVFKQRGWK